MCCHRAGGSFFSTLGESLSNSLRHIRARQQRVAARVASVRTAWLQPPWPRDAGELYASVLRLCQLDTLFAGRLAATRVRVPSATLI